MAQLERWNQEIVRPQAQLILTLRTLIANPVFIRSSMPELVLESVADTPLKEFRTSEIFL